MRACNVSRCIVLRVYEYVYVCVCVRVCLVEASLLHGVSVDMDPL